MNISKIKNNLVISSNDLVEAKYDWSLWQKRLFVYAISQIEKDSKDFSAIRMDIKDIIKFYKGSDGQLVYKAISEAPKSLDTTIQVPYRTEDGLRYGFIKLLQKYTIPADEKDKNQYVEITFNQELKPFLLELKEKFLKYDIRNIVDLQSTHSFRFFEILKSYEYRKCIEFEISHLREILQIGNMYSSYKDFKRRIIDKAQKDLSDYCDISFTYTEKKGIRGKKVETIIFEVYKNKPSKRKESQVIKRILPIEVSLFDEIEDTQEQLIEHSIVTPEEEREEALYQEFSSVVINDFGVTPMALSKIIQEYDPERIRKQIRIIQRKMKKGGATNIAGLFMEAVKNDYNDPEEAKEIKKQERQSRSEQIKLLQMEQDDIKIDFEEKKNEKIRELTNNNPSITDEAIKIVISEPLGKKRLQMIGITDPETDDFRKDTILRIMVKNAIVNAQKPEFLEIVEDYTSRAKAIEDKIKVLSK